MASARRSGSRQGTSLPYLPPSSISHGPLGQLVLTTGHPHAKASMSTAGKPSHAEDRTNIETRAIQAKGFSVRPKRQTSSAMPSASIIFCRRGRSRPSPSTTSRMGRFARASAKALINVGKSFCMRRRPTARSTGGSPGASQGWSSGALLLSATVPSSTGSNTVAMRWRGMPERRATSSATPSPTATVAEAGGKTRRRSARR